MERCVIILQLNVLSCVVLPGISTLLTFQAGRFNAAFMQPTQQISTYRPAFSSDKAVDGGSSFLRDSCSHTHNTPTTWWAVNLEAVYRVYSVTLTTRDDCCGDRLHNFTIYGSNTGFNPTQVTDLMLCNSQSEAMETGETKTFNCTHGSNNYIDAQYISVQKTDTGNNNTDTLYLVLTLCEVQVEADCLENYYGINCAQNCNQHHCSAGTVCRKSDGICPHGCEPGYTGEKCIDECSDNYYGYPCQPCSVNCLNSSCYKFTDTGYCVDDKCEPGYFYSRQCDTECVAGSYGYNCSETCSSTTCATGTLCDRVNGHCLDGCKPGYTGNFCETMCEDGNYGDNCNFTCSPNCQESVCDKFSDIGKCQDPGCMAGFKGGNCTTVCEAGEYGNNCINDCSGNCKFNDVCSSFNGSCPAGCSRDYVGDRCDQVCEDGSYGDRCSFTCSPNCQQSVCDKFSNIGKCQDPGCKAGFKGGNCTTVCESGEYGNNCINDCSGNCQFNDVCSRSNGNCPSGCSRGYVGDSCDQECPDYTYGDNCVYDCSPNCVNPCDKTSETGSCGGECKQGYKGDNCTQECVEGEECISVGEQNENDKESNNTVIAVVVCTFLIAALVIIAVVLFKLRRSAANNNPDTNATPEIKDENETRIDENTKVGSNSIPTPQPGHTDKRHNNTNSAAISIKKQRVNQQGILRIPVSENAEKNVYVDSEDSTADQQRNQQMPDINDNLIPVKVVNKGSAADQQVNNQQGFLRIPDYENAEKNVDREDLAADQQGNQKMPDLNDYLIPVKVVNKGSAADQQGNNQQGFLRIPDYENADKNMHVNKENSAERNQQMPEINDYEIPVSADREDSPVYEVINEQKMAL